ncbi:MAG TPA: hypothetical protein VFG71_08430 [Nitrospiraceae bacterium]|nr:hypothetical protein [Nitrospiraceae bacterium]
MNRMRRSGFIVIGWIGLALVSGTVGAQTGSSAGGGERNYGGSSGSQILQEQMYEARMAEILGEPSQGQGMESQKGMKGAEESSQKMQREPTQAGSQGQQGVKGGGSPMEHDTGAGDKMMEKSKGKQ